MLEPKRDAIIVEIREGLRVAQLRFEEYHFSMSLTVEF
jgi:hypothetical protein